MSAGKHSERLTNARQFLTYWGFLVAKLAGAAVLSGSSLWLLNLFFAPYTRLFHIAWLFSFDLVYTTLVGVWFLFSYGLVYLAFWDQRYRCRTCLRRLCMPVETGSWSYMLRLGRPQMEYICAYGHGKLNVEEFQATGKVAPAWTEHGDIWDELFAAHGPGSDDDDSRR